MWWASVLIATMVDLPKVRKLSSPNLTLLAVLQDESPKLAREAVEPAP